jgi:hypothetical protein
MGEGSSHASRGTSIGEILGPSSAPAKGCSVGSTKNEAAQILADALGVILPRMRCSFIDRQYLPLTGMHQSEWEIILEELTRMGLIVKKEPISNGEE